MMEEEEEDEWVKDDTMEQRANNKTIGKVVEVDAVVRSLRREAEHRTDRQTASRRRMGGHEME